EELTALGGNVYRVPRDKLNDRLIEFLRERKVEAVLMWDSVEGVDEIHLTRDGIRAVRSADPSLRVGITGVASAIAETGERAGVRCRPPARQANRPPTHRVHPSA